MRESTRITAFIEEDLAKEFTKRTRQAGLSGTALLSNWLPGELNYLAEIPSNTERKEAVWRHLGGPHKRRRLNVTLARQDAERLEQLCQEKRVPRDSFISVYIYFLVNGTDGICEGPLKKIGDILANPRHEYEEKRRNSPKEDRFLSPSNDEGTLYIDPAFPEENPYIGLYVPDEILNKWDRFMEEMKDRKGERV